MPKKEMLMKNNFSKANLIKAMQFIILLISFANNF